uniref:Uncharacterized protein n=1 Tax=Candidatus Kentrum sp. TC TaxID=2126339 RepID=A0A450ZU75_9GAMM|nr:MAG: hypothetical protein BECKTC1821F_GA0114240_10177 [Candidatus Kentron sp. TC]
MQGVLGELWRNDTGIKVLPLKQKGFFRHLRDLGNRFVTGKETANPVGRGLDLGLDDCGCNERKASRIYLGKELLGWFDKLSSEALPQTNEP